MSGLLTSAKPYRIKAAHRRRRKIASGHRSQRYYDPGIGRFLSVDPVTADGNTGSNFNRYWYANNNPYKFTDPDGRAADTILDAAFIIYDTGQFLGASAAALVGTVTGNDSLQSAGLAGMRETGANLGASVASAAVPGLIAPVARGALKGGNIVENAAKGKAGEAATRAKLGDKVAGEQVTFKTSDGTRARPDFVTKGGGIVETKTGGAQLSPGQAKLKADVDAGRQVTPVGRNATDAGLPAGQPTTMKSCTVDRPGC